MKKKGILFIVLFVMSIILYPFGVSAGSKIDPTDSKGNYSTECQKNTAGTTATCYVALTVDEGSTVNSFTFKATLKNLVYSGVREQNSWNVEAQDNGETVEFKVSKAGGLSGGKEIVARMTYTVPNVGEDCSIVIDGYQPDNEEPTENPKCKVEDGKYYCENGEECTKEEYDEKCTTPTENPQTGSFVPYAVIIAGVAVAGGLYFLTKKNKIYHM